MIRFKASIATLITLVHFTAILGCKNRPESGSSVRALRSGGAIEDLSTYQVKNADELNGLRQELVALHPDDILFDPQLPDWVAPATRKAKTKEDIFFIQSGLSALSKIAINGDDGNLSRQLYETKVAPAKLTELFMLTVPQATREIFKLDGVSFREDQIMTDRDAFYAIESLTVTEVICVKDYTVSGFGRLNHSLRSENPGEAKTFIHVARCLASGANKLPAYKGLALRGDKSLPPEEIARYKVGSEQEEGQFLSATEGADVLDQFKGSIETRISAINARRISVLSETTGENEVLFPPGSKYKIIKVSKKQPRSEDEPSIVIELEQTK